MVYSILPINEQKQFDLRHHNSKVEFFWSFFGELKIPKRHFEINWPLVAMPIWGSNRPSTKKDAQENQISPQRLPWCSKAGIQGNVRSSVLYCMIHKKIQNTIWVKSLWNHIHFLMSNSKFQILNLILLKKTLIFKCEFIYIFDPWWNDNISQSIWCRTRASSCEFFHICRYLHTSVIFHISIVICHVQNQLEITKKVSIST